MKSLIPVQKPKSSRDPRMVIMLGTTGTGKSSLLKKLIVAKLKTKHNKVLIITPHEEEWQGVRLLPSEGKLPVYTGVAKVLGNNSVVNWLMNESGFNNGMVIFEDCRSYISGALDMALHGLCISRKQRAFDIYCVVHGFDDVPPKFFQFVTLFCLFKTNDNLKRSARKINDIETIEKVKNKVDRLSDTMPKEEYKGGLISYHEWIKR